MTDYDFYKNKFERELNRRNDLDSAINNPIAGITIIVGLISYILSKNDFKIWNYIDCIVSTVLVISTITSLIALFYIFLSNNNLFKGFNYLNFGLLKDYRICQKEIVEYNKKVINEDDKKEFESEIIDKIISYSDNHTIINDKRAFDLYKSRQFVVISFILTIFNLIIITINNFKI
ncbi:MAG: hypothetical protein O9282_03760 [Flavobacterium sp.]|jgi:hypothetical protein|uniref:hypothetical protein n=1 Tax=Flavobacterium sp. TaxID=239 RepID=UPI0022BF3414|nr:hypothetical protein [Flavobacterium sp.]MCZ8090113.1 hypothetical protein [Flavobacterium sp.]MCZ8330409.1 hypothetical protein [Flavobacterium sp.]